MCAAIEISNWKKKMIYETGKIFASGGESLFEGETHEIPSFPHAITEVGNGTGQKADTNREVGFFVLWGYF